MSKIQEHKDVIQKAIALNDKGLYESAISEIEKHILSEEIVIESSELLVFYVHLGHNYMELESFEKSLKHFENALEIDSNDEFSSLGKYIVLAKMNRDVEAVKEMKRYLSSNSANLYKDTLKELLSGLSDGFMILMKDDIIELCQKNGIKSV